jgi:hypothetical protein
MVNKLTEIHANVNSKTIVGGLIQFEQENRVLPLTADVIKMADVLKMAAKGLGPWL